MNQILIIFLALLTLLIAISVYYHLSTVKKEQFKDSDLKVMLFYATWCPHCERYLESGDFDKFEKQFGSKYNVAFQKYDYDQNKTLGDKYNISGFPSIIAEDKSGKIYKFEGDRNSESDMEKFIKASLK